MNYELRIKFEFLEIKMKKRILLSVLLLVVAFTFSCRTPTKETKIPYDRPLPPGQYALRKITDPLEIPDFTTEIGKAHV
jgi:hypothetical protein